MTAPLILASGSARRKRLLMELGVAFDVAVPDVEEVHYLDDLHRSVHENATLKCRWGREHYPDAAVLAADTGIAFEGRTIMKPASRAEAFQFLRTFADHTHTVMTGVALAMPGHTLRVQVVESRVTFRPLTDATINAYIEKVNPLDRAGAYDIAACGNMLVDHYEGSYTNIVGLPCELIKAWLAIRAV